MPLRIFGALAELVLLLFVLVCEAQPSPVPHDPLPPARLEDVVGVWIGYLPQHYLFYRLELDQLNQNSGGGGFLATVYGNVETSAYRVVGWHFEGMNGIEIPLKPIDDKGPLIKLRGTAHGGNRDHLFLEVIDPITSWHAPLTMYRESNYAKNADDAKERIVNARRKAEK